eukprot:TRINITY_DN3438_c0_g1_i5.p1 TRINITY_DN3438_c0_g1~~TRINITY_DN3438_c0_g1_i5.p1  ORF type:complete len:314 (-),score=43.74 TRINITY_DN3438_c0_g1_i5:264-1121(-)
MRARVMLGLCLSLGFACNFAGASSCMEDEAPAVSWLQSAVTRHQNNVVRAGQIPEPTKLLEPFEAAMCAADHSADLNRPVQQIIDEIGPTFDGFCHFWSHVPWFHGTPSIHFFKNYVQDTNATLQMFGGYLGLNKGQLVTYNIDGAPPGLKSHLDAPNYAYDDPYCWSLGFLKNQGLDGNLISNYEAWKAIGQEECRKIQAEYNFTDEEMTVADHVDYNPTINAKSKCAAGLGPAGCTPVTIREYKKHAYLKCLLGDESPEMTYCYMRGCLLPGNYIGHGSDCAD